MQAELQLAAQNMAVGMFVVFAILLFLMLVISLFRFLPKDLPTRQAKAEKENTGTAPVPSVADKEIRSAETTEEEIAAVLAAAIYAAEAEAPSATGYRVRRIRRAQERMNA